MKRVKWRMTGETLVATDDEEEARRQVLNLLANAIYERDTSGLCVSTRAEAEVFSVTEHRVYRPPPPSEGENSVRTVSGGLPEGGKKR